MMLQKIFFMLERGKGLSNFSSHLIPKLCFFGRVKATGNIQWRLHDSHTGDQGKVASIEGSFSFYSYSGWRILLNCVAVFLVAQRVKNLPEMQVTQVQSLGQEDLLEKGVATHSGILAWQIPWSEEPGGLQFLGSQRAGTWLSNFQFHLLCGCLKYWIRAECPGGSVSESSCSKCRGPRFNPWSGN